MENPAATLETAIQTYEAGNLRLAEILCHQVLDREPDDLDALCLLGVVSHKLQQANQKISEAIAKDPGLGYHHWYYNHAVWDRTSWLGIKVWKSVSDMWNYQEIIFDLKPSLIVEFGTFCGGSALFFSSILQAVGNPYKVLSVDISHDNLDPKAKLDENVEFMLESSAAQKTAQRVAALRAEFPGTVFAILDSDHSKQHVLAEMLLLKPLLQPGDYLVVEDSNINGHPVLPGWGDGPYEAIQEYFEHFPNDYEPDREREKKFGFTFAEAGFLVRVAS